ncbi:MAG: YihY/virulence factor BrkB family protein [Acidobacteriota bacterium]
MGRHLHTFSLLLRRTLVATYRHGGLGVAKGVAYSALLAFFPLLATTVMLVVQARAEYVLNAVSAFLSQILPPGTESLVIDYLAVKGRRPVLLPVSAMLLSLLAASGAIVSLMEGFRRAYGIASGRSLVHERVVAVLLVCTAAVLVLGASAVVVSGSRAERWIGAWVGLAPAGALGTLARDLVALAAIVLGASILYYFGPNRRQRWRGVWPGAVVATVLWFGATSLFAWYVRNMAGYNVMYGGIAASIALLVWMYLLAVIALVGCEFNAARERECEETP